MNHPGENRFWTFNLGHLLVLTSMLAGFIIFMMKFENRIAQVENNQRSLTDGLTQIRQMVERMDSQGTNASQRGILRDTEAVTSNTRLIENLERIATDMVPKVERIDVNLSNLIREQRDRKP